MLMTNLKSLRQHWQGTLRRLHLLLHVREKAYQETNLKLATGRRNQRHLL
jgi:hypothetical protein